MSNNVKKSINLQTNQTLNQESNPKHKQQILGQSAVKRI
jgi:hypothetical protein